MDWRNNTIYATQKKSNHQPEQNVAQSNEKKRKKRTCCDVETSVALVFFFGMLDIFLSPKMNPSRQKTKKSANNSSHLKVVGFFFAISV